MPRRRRARPGERDIAALLEILEQRLATPHRIGRRQNDCIAFMLAAVKAQTGHNPIGRASWSSWRGALRVLRRLAGPGVDRRAAIERLLDRHFRRIAPAEAMRGDIAGVSDPLLGIHPAIVEGETLAMPGDDGLKRLPRRAMVAAWSAVDRPE
ncbi:MAG TPA: hypothetical protein VM265_07870 [Sphingomicrobium sp.]|nr:hypothetical protein [Sphingomicrobium sp.]